MPPQPSYSKCTPPTTHPVGPVPPQQPQQQSLMPNKSGSVAPSLVPTTTTSAAAAPSTHCPSTTTTTTTAAAAAGQTSVGSVVRTHSQYSQNPIGNGTRKFRSNSSSTPANILPNVQYVNAANNNTTNATPTGISTSKHLHNNWIGHPPTSSSSNAPTVHTTKHRSSSPPPVSPPPTTTNPPPAVAAVATTTSAFTAVNSSTGSGSGGRRPRDGSGGGGGGMPSSDTAALCGEQHSQRRTLAPSASCVVGHLPPRQHPSTYNSNDYQQGGHRRVDVDVVPRQDPSSRGTLTVDASESREEGINCNTADTDSSSRIPFINVNAFREVLSQFFSSEDMPEAAQQVANIHSQTAWEGLVSDLMKLNVARPTAGVRGELQETCRRAGELSDAATRWVREQLQAKEYNPPHRMQKKWQEIKNAGDSTSTTEEPPPAVIKSSGERTPDPTTCQLPETPACTRKHRINLPPRATRTPGVSTAAPTTQVAAKGTSAGPPRGRGPLKILRPKCTDHNQRKEGLAPPPSELYVPKVHSFAPDPFDPSDEYKDDDDPGYRIRILRKEELENEIHLRLSSNAAVKAVPYFPAFDASVFTMLPPRPSNASASTTAGGGGQTVSRTSSTSPSSNSGRGAFNSGASSRKQNSAAPSEDCPTNSVRQQSLSGGESCISGEGRGKGTSAGRSAAAGSGGGPRRQFPDDEADVLSWDGSRSVSRAGSEAPLFSAALSTRTESPEGYSLRMTGSSPTFGGGTSHNPESLDNKTSGSAAPTATAANSTAGVVSETNSSVAGGLAAIDSAGSAVAGGSKRRSSNNTTSRGGSNQNSSQKIHSRAKDSSTKHPALPLSTAAAEGDTEFVPLPVGGGSKGEEKQRGDVHRRPPNHQPVLSAAETGSFGRRQSLFADDELGSAVVAEDVHGDQASDNEMFKSAIEALPGSPPSFSAVDNRPTLGLTAKSKPRNKLTGPLNTDEERWCAMYCDGDIERHRAAKREEKRAMLGAYRHPASGDARYPMQMGNTILDCFNLKIICERDKTGLEDYKDFDVQFDQLIAGRYRIECVLGQAAFSRALQCFDTYDKKKVCIKMIKNEKDFVDQSLDEIKLLRYILQNGDVDQLRCLRLIDFFYFKEHLMIVTELLRENMYEYGRKYKEKYKVGYFTMGRVQKLARQILVAVNYIHDLQLIHCDLKPENILLKDAQTAEIRVIDFGSSCFQDDNLSTYVQSRSYRAPEVILQLPYDQRIDIWSVGCIVAELWTGYVLFLNDSVESLLARIIGIIGLIPPYMIDKTPANVLKHRFSLDGQLIQSLGNSHGDVKVLLPKKSSLNQRLRSNDSVFLSFVEFLLQIDPAKRPTAAEALEHEFLRPGRYSDGLTEADFR